MAEIPIQSENIGQIQIADEVIAIIAGTAALETEGIVSTTAQGIFASGDIAGILGKKNLSKGVKVTVNGNEVEIELNLLVKFGCKINEVSLDVQKRVKNAVETMTGLTVSKIDLTISGVLMGREQIVKENLE